MKKVSTSKKMSLRQYFPLSYQDTVKSLLIFIVACLFCAVFQQSDNPTDTHVPLIFVLAVLIISRSTNGYFYGILASLAGTIVANYIFTFPYFVLNFTMTGYPLCFTVMLACSILTCAMTSQVKQAERLRTVSQQEKMRANLLRAVSHDLRTPLTSILGATSAVIDNQSTLTEEQTKKLLVSVRDDAQWLIRIVENLLSVTRIDDGQTRIKTEEELGEEIIASAVQKFKKRFPHIRVSVQVPEEMLFIPMDATLIEQVLINLLENAVMHGKTTENIVIRLEKQENRAVFYVEDDGQGIAPEAIPRLFEGYFTHSDDTRNMGIGLSVCKTIVRAHHGEMTAGNLTQGAQFTFSLPLKKEA